MKTLHKSPFDFVFVVGMYLQPATGAAFNDSLSLDRAAINVLDIRCALKANSVQSTWYYNLLNEEHTECTNKHDDEGPWIMLNAYRSGGKQSIHWKYVEDGDTTNCLKDWLYYNKKGNSLIAKIGGVATRLGDSKNKPWCATNVYRKGGRQGYQWDHCLCSSTTDAHD